MKKIFKKQSNHADYDYFIRCSNIVVNMKLLLSF